MIWKNIMNRNDIENIENIHPYAQRQLDKLYDSLKDNTNCNTIIVFGSATNVLMNPWSDIDLYLDIDRGLPDEVLDTITELDFPLDIWFKSDFIDGSGEELLEEINKGIKINIKRG